MARSLARQVGGKGVTVNNLAPGAISTERNADMLADPDYRARIETQIPVGRLGTPEDLVGAALLLCSDAGAYINGVDLYVDGGFHIS
jgi:NAD(P)-dependent dehydrogenase (short-subunit alcohol dehydrogenase family)